MATGTPRLAFDIGGTFTDIVLISADGQIATDKVLSIPETIVAAVKRNIENTLMVCGRQPLASLVHGTTIASNALLEGKGAVTGLLTTRGFRDELEIRRYGGAGAYDFSWERTAPLIPRRRRKEVTERIDAKGEIVTPLDREETRQAIESLLQQGVEAIAICFYNSYVNPVHEQLAQALVRQIAPGLPVCASFEVLPQIREYERVSTTAVNAVLMPAVNRYLDSVEGELARYCPTLRIVQSNGGLMTIDYARVHPIHMVESGPAAGVLAAACLSRESRIERAVSFDMGGTTVKACLIENHTPVEKNEVEVGGKANVGLRFNRGAGYAVAVPSLDIVEAGAGGGSIARAAGGGLRVGPDSAGTAPGPVCYGRGGTQPTVTDANVVLGYMNPLAIAGGAVPIDRAAAIDAFEKTLCRQLNLSSLEAAYGVYQVANAAMMRTIRAVTTERGRVPAEYTLIAFGGSGPIHAADLASSLGIATVCVPLFPGLFSSLGLMLADLRYDYVQSVPSLLARVDASDLMAKREVLLNNVRREVARESIDPDRLSFETFLDMRYRRQTAELTIGLPLEVAPAELLPALAERFHREHEHLYGYRRTAEPIVTVNLRVKATAPARNTSFAELGRDFVSKARAQDARGQSVRSVYFGKQLGELPTRIMERGALLNQSCAGPAIIEEFDTTVVIPPGWRATLDEQLGSIVLQVE